MTRNTEKWSCSSGAFCTGHNYDPSEYRKRSEELQKTHDYLRPATARSHDSSVRRSDRSLHGAAPASTSGSLSERGTAKATSDRGTRQHQNKLHADVCTGRSAASSVLSRLSTPRTSTGQMVPRTHADAVCARPNSQHANTFVPEHRLDHITFDTIPSVCTTRSKINVAVPYVAPYTVDRLLLERQREARTRRLRPSSAFSTAPSCAGSRIATGASTSSKLSDSRLVGDHGTKQRQDIFLTTRNTGIHRQVAPTVEDCRLPEWLNREQIRRDAAREQAREQEAADHRERQRLDAVAAALNYTSKSPGTGLNQYLFSHTSLFTMVWVPKPLISFRWIWFAVSACDPSF